jgi:hypothetical protein
MTLGAKRGRLNGVSPTTALASDVIFVLIDDWGRCRSASTDRFRSKDENIAQQIKPPGTEDAPQVIFLENVAETPWRLPRDIDSY